MYPIYPHTAPPVSFSSDCNACRVYGSPTSLISHDGVIKWKRFVQIIECGHPTTTLLPATHLPQLWEMGMFWTSYEYNSVSLANSYVSVLQMEINYLELKFAYEPRQSTWTTSNSEHPFYVHWSRGCNLTPIVVRCRSIMETCLQYCMDLLQNVLTVGDRTFSHHWEFCG